MSPALELGVTITGDWGTYNYCRECQRHSKEGRNTSSWKSGRFHWKVTPVKAELSLKTGSRWREKYKLETTGQERVKG